jgi:CheY-like chemotaxis protein
MGPILKEFFFMSKKKHVLIVEDDPDVLQVLNEIFLDEGLQVTTAVDGLDAMEKFNLSRPDIIFADIMMPGLDGAQMAIKIKALAPDLPIILVSGRFNDLIDKHYTGEIKCDQVLYKPFTKTDIIQTVSMYLAEKGT